MFIRIGATIALKPRINQRLNILEPITFHTDNAPLPLIEAIADKNNSGADVPKATIVNQINKAETLRYFAILTLEFTRWFAENARTNNQTHNKIKANIIIEKERIKILYAFK